MNEQLQEQFFAALRLNVKEYTDAIPILNAEQVVGVYENLTETEMTPSDIPMLASGYMYVGIDYPDVDDFWSDWYSEREDADGFR